MLDSFFYNNVMGTVLIMTFAIIPIIFVVAVILVTVGFAIVHKLVRFTSGYRPKTAFAIISELVSVIPLVVIVYFWYLTF